MPDNPKADALIDEIDAGTLMAKRHATIRSLQSEMPHRDEDVRELVELYDSRAALDRDGWAERLWQKIETSPLNQQGALRLALGLLQPDGDLDWHEAGYFIDWSQEQGLSDLQIIRAFHSDASVR